MSSVLSRLFGPFRRRPGIALVVVATLALGVGATTAVFSVVNGVLIRPLPYREADRLVAVFTHSKKHGRTRNPSSPADFLAWKAAGSTLSGMTAAHPWSPVLTGQGQPEPIPGLKATPELFTLLEEEAARGRAFRADRGEELEGDVVVLSHDLWKTRFGGDVSLVGRALVLDGKPYTVVGVMPAGFEFPPFWATGAKLWTPLRLTAEDETNHSQFLRIFARLRPGATVEKTQAELEAVASRLAVERPRSNADVAVNVEPLSEPVVSRVRPALLVLFGAVALVLLIAGANVASILLAHGLSRERELALRAALGASRGRLTRQLLLESLMLSGLSGLLGIWLAALGVDALKALAPADFPRLDEVGLDLRVAAFGLLAALVAGAFAGLLPALRASRPDVAAALKQGERSVGGRHWGQDALVTLEFAVAVVLLVGAGLLTRSVLGLLDPRAGFQSEGVVTMTVSFAGSPFAEAARQTPFLEEVLDRARAIPGVEEAAVVNHLPIAGDTWSLSFTVEGQTHDDNDPPQAVFRVASAGYPKALGIPVLRGRTFGAEDGAGAAPVVLINQALARRYWPNEDPVGRRIRQGGRDSREPWATVVGVLGDTSQSSLVEPTRPEVVFPYAQNPVAWYRATSLVLRTRVEPLRLAEAAKAQVWAVGPDLPVTDVRTLDAVLRENVAPQRFNAVLLGAFAAFALLLAAVGVYGAMSYAVSLRAQEIGVRMAMGARGSEVFRMILRRGMALAGTGAGVGLLGALGLSRLLSSLLHDVSPKDPLTFATMALLLLSTSALACAVPAWRATRVDPLTTLRMG